MKNEQITVLGAGYVGLTTAVLLALVGHKTYLVEPNKLRRETILKGKSFFYEEGLDILVEKVIKSGTLIPTDSNAQATTDSSIIFSCVGTPDKPDGSSNLSYVFESAEETFRNCKDGSIFVQKSTVPVGTGEELESLAKKVGRDIQYVSNPEFLREGTALFDTLFFDRVVVGGNDISANKKVLGLYKNIEADRKNIADLADISYLERTGEYITASRNSAELIKVTSNAFLALKISFANSIAKLSDQVGADIVEVMDAVGSDKRIGRAFLNAGRGYGGGCFPKDVSGLIMSAREHGVELEIMKAVHDVNMSMPQYVIDKLQSVVDISKSNVAVLGLSFKAGTSDARNSPGVKIANLLSSQANTIKVYDPKANEEAREELVENITICESLQDTLGDVTCIIVATDWPEFKDMNLYKEVAVVIDALNCLDRSKASPGTQVIGIGR